MTATPRATGARRDLLLFALLLALALVPASGPRAHAQEDGTLLLSIAGEYGLPPAIRPAPDDSVQAVLVRAGLEVPRAVMPPTELIALELHPPDPFLPAWRVSFPRGCFQETAGGNYRKTEDTLCGAALTQLQPDGSTRSLDRFVSSLEAVLIPPADDGEPWELRMELVTDDLPEDGHPPDPYRGRSVLQVGDAVGEARHDVVSWGGA